jgi:Protein of unknown function (DUF3888)
MKLKSSILTCSLILVLFFVFPMAVHAKQPGPLPEKDSAELRIQDMFMLFLLPHIGQAVNEYYSKLLTVHPMIYPYFVEVIHSERVNGFRGYHFKLTVEAYPTVGPHITVGKDRLTFEIAPTIPNLVKLLDYTHLQTDPLPPHWQDIIKKHPSD